MLFEQWTGMRVLKRWMQKSIFYWNMTIFKLKLASNEDGEDWALA